MLYIHTDAERTHLDAIVQAKTEGREYRLARRSDKNRRATAFYTTDESLAAEYGDIERYTLNDSDLPEPPERRDDDSESVSDSGLDTAS